MKLNEKIKQYLPKEPVRCPVCNCCNNYTNNYLLNDLSFLLFVFKNINADYYWVLRPERFSVYHANVKAKKLELARIMIPDEAKTQIEAVRMALTKIMEEKDAYPKN